MITDMYEQVNSYLEEVDYVIVGNLGIMKVLSSNLILV